MYIDIYNHTQHTSFFYRSLSGS